MKRGLVLLDPAEVPEHAWRERVQAVQRDLAERRIDVALVYGDVFSSDDIAYLTNLCIYWNEGVLAVPAEGEPVFLTKLSPRVHPWMRRVSTVTRIESGKSFAALAAGLLEGRTPGTVGLVDAGLWPARAVEEVRAALPEWRIEEVEGLVREHRTVASQPELALLEKGARVVAEAADEAAGDGLGRHERISAVERIVRNAGFLDVGVNTASTSDGVECVQVTGQYRTCWLHASRLTAPAQPGVQWPAALREALEAVLAAARAGADGERLTAAARPALSGLPDGADAKVGWVNQADLASGGEYRAGAGRLTAGSVLAFTVDVLFADGGYAAVGETALVTEDGSRLLTVPATEATPEKVSQRRAG
jgi:Xaa-Pro aminopeptidase